jgi:hypothetical protein
MLEPPMKPTAPADAAADDPAHLASLQACCRRAADAGR